MYTESLSLVSRRGSYDRIEESEMKSALSPSSLYTFKFANIFPRIKLKCYIVHVSV